MLGIAFKENCLDIRNTKAIDIYNELKEFDIALDVYDPWAKPEELMHGYNIKSLHKLPEGKRYNAIVLAVAHDEFKIIKFDTLKYDKTILYDMKGILGNDIIDGKL